MKILVNNGYEYFKLLPMNENAPDNWFDLSIEIARFEGQRQDTSGGFLVLDNRVIQEKRKRDMTRWLIVSDEDREYPALHIERCLAPDYLIYTSLHIECRRPLR